MMGDKDQELGLSLSLGGGGGGGGFPSNIHHTPLQINLMPSLMVPASVSSPTPSTGFNTINNIPHKPIWATDIFPSSDPKRGGSGEMVGGIDVNRAPSWEEEPGVSSPNSTVSSVSGKRSEREIGNGMEEQEMDRGCYRGTSDEEDGDNSRKKLRLTKDQSAVLEESFKEHNTLNPKQKMALAKQLGLRPRQVEVWFQNRRARTKLKQTEVDCEFLKKCCENLTEENRRLQKEVHELRALKLSPQFYMQMTPPTTLTMCPACERVGVPPQPGPSPPDPRPHMGPHSHHRRVPINPWAPAIPFDTLRPSL